MRRPSRLTFLLFSATTRRNVGLHRRLEHISSSTASPTLGCDEFFLRGGMSSSTMEESESSWAVEVLAVPNASRSLSSSSSSSSQMMMRPGTPLFANVTETADLARLDALYAYPLGDDQGDHGIFRTYFAGAKKLWSDVGEWRRLRRQRRSRELTWREERLVYEAPRHLARMFPILLNPLPPPFGLVLIGLASAWPRLLLTPEFWTPNQWLDFARRDSEHTRRRYNNVLAECRDTIAAVSNRLVDAPSAKNSASARSGSPSSAATAASSSFASSSVTTSPWTAPLSAIIEPFEDGAPLGLDVLSRRHLVRLAQIVRPRPFGRFFLCLTRTPRLRAKLRKAALAADRDDHRLAREFGAAKFDSADLFRICKERGLSVEGTDVLRAKRVRAWLDARDALLAVHPEGPLPPSFVLHMPALFVALISDKSHTKLFRPAATAR